VALVESTMDLDFYEQSGQHRIKPEIDDELASINGQIIELDGKAQKLLRKLADRINREVKLESNVELGYFFRITLKVRIAIKLSKPIHASFQSVRNSTSFHFGCKSAGHFERRRCPIYHQIPGTVN
jgi:hypothetical protein